MSRKYVVAISQKEAAEIARDRPDCCHETRNSAEEHLAEVKAPPTDPHYANQYRIYAVADPSGEQAARSTEGRNAGSD